MLPKVVILGSRLFNEQMRIEPSDFWLLFEGRGHNAAFG
jgi:hypothetical protein